MSNALQFLMSRPFKILIAILILCIIALRIIPYFIDSDKYRAMLITRIGEISGKTVTINGKIEIALSTKLQLNIPNISIVDANNPSQESYLKANNLILSTSLFNFLLGEKTFDKLELDDAHINIAILPNSKNNYVLNTLEKMLTNDSAIYSLKSIEIRKSIISYSLNLGQGIFERVNLSLKKAGDSIEISGNLHANNELITLDLTTQLNKSLDKNSKIKLNIKSDGLSVNFNGNVQNIDNKVNILGHAKSQVKSPELLMFELVKIMPFLEWVQQKDFSEPIEISSDFSIIDNNVQATNIKISSTYLNGTGGFGFSLNDNLNLEIFLDIDNLDITKFASFKEDELPMASSEKILDDSRNLDINKKNTDYINFSFIDTAAINIILTAKQIAMKDIGLENLKLFFSTDNGIINNGELEFYIKNGQHGSKVMLANIGFKKVDNTNLLLGDFINEGNNINETLRLFNLSKYIDINTDQLSYKIASKIIFAPKEISIFEIDGKIGDEGSFSGSIATKQGEVNDYNLDLKFINLKLENFELPLFKERLYTLLTKSKDDDYLSYFRWFRTLSSSYNIKLEFIDTEFQNEKISNLVNFCKMSSGSMLLKGNIKSEFADGNYALALTAKSLKPTISISLEGDYLDYNRLKKLMFNFLDTSGSEAQDNSTPNAVTSDNQIWSDKKFNLFNIYKYEGQFDINLGSLKLYDQRLTDLKLASHTSGEILYLDNIYFGIYGGQFQARGNISFFEQILYQFSFTASGLESKELIANSFPKLNYLEGPIAFTGSVVTQGDNPKSLVANLSASSNFAASGINLSNLDADVVVDIALKRTALDKDQILSSLDTALNSGVTNIMNLSGNLRAEKGVFETKNAFFKTRFSSAIFAMLLDLNNLTISTNTLFLFLPYVGNPISYGISANGKLNESLQKAIDANNLLRYVKKEYKIVTAQDILDAQQAEQQQQANKKASSEDQDSKNYLYYKILEQKLIEKRKAEDNLLNKPLGVTNESITTIAPN